MDIRKWELKWKLLAAGGAAALILGGYMLGANREPTPAEVVARNFAFQDAVRAELAKRARAEEKAQEKAHWKQEFAECRMRGLYSKKACMNDIDERNAREQQWERERKQQEWDAWRRQEEQKAQETQHLNDQIKQYQECQEEGDCDLPDPCDGVELSRTIICTTEFFRRLGRLGLINAKTMESSPPYSPK